MFAPFVQDLASGGKCFYLSLSIFMCSRSKKEKKKFIETKQENKEKNDKPGKKKKEKEIQHDEVSSTTTVSSFNISAHIKNYKSRQYLLVKAGQSWLDVQVYFILFGFI